MKAKRGRPRKPSKSRVEGRRKETMRNASAKYYKKNRKKVLDRAKRRKK